MTSFQLIQKELNDMKETIRIGLLEMRLAMEEIQSQIHLNNIGSGRFEYLTVGQLARQTGLPEEYILSMKRRNEIKSIKIGATTYFEKSEVKKKFKGTSFSQ